MVDWAGWAQAGLALVSLIGAGIAWWRSNLSRDAKNQATIEANSAKEAERRAEAHLLALQELAAATVKQAEATERLPEAISGLANKPTERLKIEHKNGSLYTLRNMSQTVPFSCGQVLNRGQFVRVDLDTPFTLAPGQGIDFFALGAAQLPLPSDLVLDEETSDEPLYVAIPPKR